MKKILLIIPFLFSNYLYSSNVSGYCYLQNQTDHSGIKVLFEAVTPSATTDSTYTNTDGSYNIGLTGGIYSINFFWPFLCKF